LTEEWRKIEGYEGLYQVSNLGRVKSLSRIIIDRRGIPHYVNERILKQTFDKDALFYGNSFSVEIPFYSVM